MAQIHNINIRMKSNFLLLTTTLLLSVAFTTPITTLKKSHYMGNNFTKTDMMTKLKFTDPKTEVWEDPFNTSRFPRRSYIQRVRRLLDIYLESLRGFFSEKYFDYVRFEKELSRISEELFDIDKLMAKIVPPKDELIKQFDFTRDMYRTMVTFNEFRKNLKNFSAPEDRLHSAISTLTLKSYELYDYQGSPDYLIEGYEDYLAELFDRWNYLKQERDTLKRSSSIARLILDIDFNKVRISLWELARNKLNEDVEEYFWIPF